MNSTVWTAGGCGMVVRLTPSCIESELMSVLLNVLLTELETVFAVDASGTVTLATTLIDGGSSCNRRRNRLPLLVTVITTSLIEMGGLVAGSILKKFCLKVLRADSPKLSTVPAMVKVVARV